MEKAKTSLIVVRRSTSLHAIDTIISALKTTLEDLSSETVTRQSAVLTTLAEALYFRFHYSFDIVDLDDAILHLQCAIKFKIPKKGCLYSFIALQLSNLLATRFDVTNNVYDLQEALSQFVDVHTPEEAEEDKDGVYVESLLHFARYSHDIQFARSGNVQDLNTAVDGYRKAITDLPVQDDNYLAALVNLSNILATRFDQKGQENDLEESVLLLTEALQLRPLSHSSRAGYLNNLASNLLTRFQKSGGQYRDLEDAIILNREALSLRPLSHPHRSSTLDNLAIALQTRFLHGSDIQDLNDAICLHGEALELREFPHPDRYSSLTNLAEALLIRHERLGKGEDISKALSLKKQLLDLIGPSHPSRSLCLNGLASALSAKFRHGGRQTHDLDEAILLHEQALKLQPAPHPGRPDTLNDLAMSLSTRYDYTSQQRDLDNGVILLEEALHLQASSNSRNRSGFLYNLASVLWTRFCQGRIHRSDLHRAIVLSKEALELQIVSHSHRAAVLTTFGNALWARYDLEGQYADLQEAILCHRKTLDLQNMSHPNRTNCLNSLATGLLERFRHGGQRADLDEAISLHIEALKLRPPPHSERTQSLSNLAVAFLTRYGTSNQKEDLTQSIGLFKQALDLQDQDHPKRHIALTNLAVALGALFSKDGNQANLDQAIVFQRQALAIGETKNRKPGLFHNLAIAISARFEHGGQHHDFDEALALYKQAIDLYPLSHPGRALSLQGSGKLLAHAHLLTGRKESEHLEQAMSTFSSVLAHPSGLPVHVRFLLATTWASYADVHQHSSALDAYDAVSEVMPQLAAFDLDIQSRREALNPGTDGLARKAAHCAIRNNRVDKAIEYLEAGRAVFWSQALRLRSPFDQLRVVNSELGERLQGIAAALERGSHRNVVVKTFDNRAKMTLEEEASQLEHLGKEWLKGLDEVRNIAGFEDFLKPLRLSSLKLAATNSPVVFLIPNDHASDCIIMTSTTTHHIPLSPKLCTSELRKLVKMIQSAALFSTVMRSSEGTEGHENWVDNGEDRLGARRLGGTIPSDQVFKCVLQILWNEVVMPVVGFLDIQVSPMPR